MTRLTSWRAWHAIVLVSLISCGRADSDITAMESNDWFKDGVDRFYLAHLSNEKLILEGYPQTQGEKYFFGVGCYGEPADPTSKIKVKKSAHSKETIAIPLNKRTMLYQFDLIDRYEEPQKGKCKILLGDRISPRQISNGGKLIAKDTDYGTSKMRLGQVLSANALGCSLFVAKAAKFAATAVAGGFATAKTAGVAAPVVVPVIVLESGELASSGLFCMLWTNLTIETLDKFKIGENQKILSLALAKAADYALHEMELDGAFDNYQQLANSGDPKEIFVAAAIWNKYFIPAFNEKISDQFENGWGGATKFFNAVEKVETEYMSNASTYTK